MKGDFSRWSFDPTKHYHGVLKQQGRVDLDADWNEQNAIEAHRIEEESIDVIGASGAPAGDAGFMLTAVNNGTNLSISKGRAYVDGILCENEQNVLITAQPDLPGFQLPTQAGTYVAYLEVWQRHITALDDQSILEVALGGPDTCTRARTVCQVNLALAGAVGAAITCSTDVSAYDTLTAPSTGTLQAQAQPTQTTPSACAVPATAGYTSLENQLYRVEINDKGDISGGKVTFKWSRENGSVVTAWTGMGSTPNTLTVSSVGPDSVLGFAAGQWVELTDDISELNFRPGTLAPVTDVEGQTISITPGASSPPINFSALVNPKIRRWDSAGLATATAGNWMTLENGVQVQFGKGTYNTGDYWLIPARTLKGNVVWPMSGGNPVAEPPEGIRRHYCRLAIVQFDGKIWSLEATCLPTFLPLTATRQVPAMHVTGVKYNAGNLTPALQNDSVVQLAGLVEPGLKINISTDAPVDPVSAQPTTCYLTVDVPYPFDVLTQTASTSAGAAGILGFQPLLLPATVSVANGTGVGGIGVNLNPGTVRPLYDLLTDSSASQFLTHLTLKGRFIWSLAKPPLYLDGAAYGTPYQDPNGTHIGVSLPSGNGTPGSDFEIWFWLARVVRPQSVTLAASTGAPKMTTTGTVTLNGYAPPGGTAITLSASTGTPSAAVSTITFSPTSLNIPVGSLTGGFGLTVAGTAAAGTYTITASNAEGDSVTTPLTIRLG